MIVELHALQAGPPHPFDVYRAAIAGSQEEIGRDLAGLAADRHGHICERVPVSDAAATDALFAAYCPSLHRRASGLSAGDGTDGFCRDRFSLSIIDEPPAFACSAAAFSGTGGPMVVRNFDFTLRSLPEIEGAPPGDRRPMVDPVYLMTIDPGPAGRKTVATVSMDLLVGVLDGINDAGFCAALLALDDDPRLATTPRADRFDELTVVRVLLETCATVADAVALFGRLPKQTVFLPCHYLVADRRGDAAVLEWDADGARHVRRHGGTALCCTNHSLCGLPTAAAATGDNAASGPRLERLADAFAGGAADESAAWRAAEAVRQAAFDAGGNIFGGTLWTALYRLDPPGVEIRFLDSVADGMGRYSHAYAASPVPAAVG